MFGSDWPLIRFGVASGAALETGGGVSRLFQHWCANSIAFS